MDIILKKFIDYLEGSIKKIETRIVLNASMKHSYDVLPEDEGLLLDVTNRQRVVRLLSIPESEWQYHAEVFNEFNMFSSLMLESPLTDDERVQLVFYFIRKNFACGILEAGASGFDAPKVRDYKFKHITAEELEDLIKRDAYRRMVEKDPSELTPKEKLQLEDIKQFIKDNPFDLSEIISKHRRVKEHYFDKIPNLKKEDILEVIKALYDFEVDKGIVRAAKSYMYKTYNIVREEKVDVSTPVLGLSINTQSNDNTISNKEYNLLDQELRKYFILSRMELVKELSSQEEIYCIALMKRMKLSEEIITKAIKIMKKARLKNKHNPIEEYLYMVDKIKYYLDNSEIKKIYKEIESYFSSLFIVEDDEYIIYREFIRLLLEDLNDLLPSSYDYELSAADEYVMKLDR